MAHLLGLVLTDLIELNNSGAKLLQLREHIRLLRLHLLRYRGIGPVQLAVDVHGVVDHVRRPQQCQAGGGDVAVRVGDQAGRDEGVDVLEEGEHHVQVEVGGDLRREVPLGGLGRVVGRGVGFGHGDEFVRGVGAGHLPWGRRIGGLGGAFEQ